MSGYVEEGRKKCEHIKPKQPTYEPSQFIPPIFGRKIQTEEIDTSGPMSPEETKRLEQIFGVYLYYG